MPTRSDRREAAARWRKAASRPFLRGRRSPETPLFVLWLLARAGAGGDRVVPFPDVAPSLGPLLDRYGSPGSRDGVGEGFWRLQSDRVWLVQDAARLRPSKRDPLPTGKAMDHVIGEVPKRLWAVLVEEDDLRAEVAARLLARHWPPSLHDAIRADLGLPRGGLRRRVPALDRPSVEAVLEAYGGACAVCGYDGRLGGSPLGLGAAHVRWPCLDGPDRFGNLLALCAFHHHALDRGAWTVGDDLRVIVSAEAEGGESVRDLLLRFHGQPLAAPSGSAEPLDVAMASWHREHVFRAPARS